MPSRARESGASPSLHAAPAKSGPRSSGQIVLAQLAGLLAAMISLGGLLLVLRLDGSPLTLPVSILPPTGRLSATPPSSDVLVVLDPDAITRSAQSGAGHPSQEAQRDLSAGWLEWAAQSIGPVDWATPKELVEHGTAARLVIVSTSASSSANTLLPRLEQVVSGGAVLILERPPALLEPLSGLSLRPESIPGSLSITRSSLWMPEGAHELLSRITLPVRAQTVEIRPPRPPDSDTDPAAPAAGQETPRPLLWVNEQPVLFSRPVGAGLVITSGIELGALFQRLQQGVPDPDLQVRNRFVHRQSEPLETNDLVVSEALLTAELPVADVLEDALLTLVREHSPLPGWWPYPDAHTGAFLLSHDEEGMGDRSTWMAEHDHLSGCPSTSFLVASPAITREGLERLQQLGSEVALHYVIPGPNGEDYPGSGYDSAGRYETFGLWKLRPMRRVLPPDAQRQWLAAIAPGVPVQPTTRSHFLAWTKGYTELFERLSRAGISMDSSYGPDVGNRGFLFGTARPFVPLDALGFPLPLLELPFVSAEDLGGADAAFIDRLLAQSTRDTHQALSTLHHPNAFRWHPSVANFQNWKSLCSRARAQEHWPTTFGELATFELSRRRAELRSTWDGSTLTLTFEPHAPGNTLAIPERSGSRTLRELTPSERFPQRVVQVGGQSVRLVVVPPDQTTLVATYRM